MEETEHRLRGLWDRALDGDERAYRDFLTELADRLRPYVRRQLRRLGRDGCEAEDVVQDTLMALHCKRHTYDRTVPVMAWVLAVARYKSIDFVRSAAVPSRVLPLEAAENVAGTDDSQVENSFSVRAALDALPTKIRRSIELMKVVGLNAKEAAALIGISEPAVKVNVHRGLNTMARLLT